MRWRWPTCCSAIQRWCMTTARTAAGWALRYGWGAVMSNLRRAEVAALPGFDAVFPPARTLLRDDLDDSVDPETFVQRLSGLFTVDLAQRLTPAQRERIRWHLFPERISEPAPAPAAMPPETLPEVFDPLQVMDLQQEQVARTLGDGHRVIYGVAGSGKTMIPAHRARLLAREAEPARPVLVLCYNRALADRIEALVAPDEPLRARRCRCAPSTAGAPSWRGVTASRCPPHPRAVTTATRRRGWRRR